MTVERPPRPARTSVDDRVRKAILTKAARLESARMTHVSATPSAILDAHRDAEFVADNHDLLADVEERYGLSREELSKRIFNRAAVIAMPGYYGQPAALPYGAVDRVLSEQGDELLLFVLPDEEFLTAIEHAAKHASRAVGGKLLSEDLLAYAAETLKAHGLPYAREGVSFGWSGDPATHEHAVAPALRALADSRLAGAREEFADALGKRRAGGNTNYKDAVHEAANAVESALKSLLAAHPKTVEPRQATASALFNALVAKDAQILPGYVQKLILAAPEMRNHLGGHGQGPVVVVVDSELADAALGAAAAAITVIARGLP